VTGLPIDYMRRRKAAIFEKSTRQKIARVGTYRAFAVGARDVDGFPGELYVLEEKANPLEPRLDHGTGFGPLALHMCL
jgi:hypothetical protein